MIKPNIDSTAYIANGSVVIGNVTVAKNCSIWYHSTIRSSVQPIIIGEGSNIQDNTVIHVGASHGVTIGSYVTIGHSAIIHGCSIGDNTLIGMGAIILNGAKIGKNCIIAAGTLIPQNKEIPDHSLVMGSPGKIVRQVTEEEILTNRKNAEHYIEERFIHAELDKQKKS